MTQPISGPIERDVPPPRLDPRILYLIEDMQPGDSRFFNAEPQNVKVSTWRRAKRLGWLITVRREGDGMRVWRLS